MLVEIWSDIVCPWCYIGKRRFERTLASFEHRADVQIVHRAFQLDPSAPKGRSIDRREMLMRKYGWSETQLAAADERLTRVAAAEGLEYRLALSATGNTFDAHRLAQLGKARGIQDDIIERFFRAHFTEGRSIFNPESLAVLSAEAGIDATEASRVLEGDEYADAVREDLSAARDLGISGVPFFVIAGRYAVSGAQPAEVFAEALARAWSDRHR